MIKVRLRSEGNAVKLAASLAELLAPKGVLPVIKGSLVALDDTCSKLRLTSEESLPIVRRALDAAHIRYKLILIKGEEIDVEDEGGEESPERPPRLLICPHCGFTTIYEEEYWVHLKIHYGGF